MSPMEMLSIYSNFATGGFKYPTRAIRSVVDANGKVLERFGLNVEQTIEPSSAYVLNYGLQQVMASGTGRSAYNSLPSSLKLVENQVQPTIHAIRGLSVILAITWLWSG